MWAENPRLTVNVLGWAFYFSLLEWRQVLQVGCRIKLVHSSVHQYFIFLRQGHSSASGSVVVSLQRIHALLAGLQRGCLHPAGFEWHLCAWQKLWGFSVLFWGKENARVRCVRGCPVLCSFPSPAAQWNLSGQRCCKALTPALCSLPWTRSIKTSDSIHFEVASAFKSLFEYVKIVVFYPCAGRQVMLRDACVLLIETGALLSSCFKAVSGVS